MLKAILILAIAGSAAAPITAEARTMDLVHKLSARTFKICQGPCGRTGSAPACCRCWGGDWFGTPTGGHCG